MTGAETDSDAAEDGAEEEASEQTHAGQKARMATAARRRDFMSIFITKLRENFYRDCRKAR